MPACVFAARVIWPGSAEPNVLGNSKPRIFPTVTETTTTTTKKRATANTGAKRGPKKSTTTKGAKPAGVTKKKAPAKKTSVATKVRYFNSLLPVPLLILLIG